MKVPSARLFRPGPAGARPSCLSRHLHHLGTLPAISILLCGALLFVANIGLPCPGAAESRPSDQQNEETARHHVADVQLQEPKSDWREDLMRMPIDQVCSRLKSQELTSYRLRRLSARDNPDDTIFRGWTHSQHPPFMLATPIDWNHLRTVDRSWNFWLHSWRPLQAILKEHSKSLQQNYLLFAFAVAEDWILQHPYSRRERLDSGEDFAWYDMAVGLRTPRLAYILDAMCRNQSVEAGRLYPLWHSLLAHFDYLSDDNNIKFHSNHGFYQALGQFFAAVRFSHFEHLPAFETQASDRLQHMIDRHFSSEGVHLEHSPQYHYSLTLQIATLDQPGLSATRLSLRKQYENMRDALAWMIAPNGKIANFGDSDRVDFTGSHILLGAGDLLDYATSAGTIGEAPSQRLAVFPEAGLAVVRSDWAGGEDIQEAAYLAQTAAFHSRVHKQADDLSFVWYDQGTDILIDAGRYGYLGRTEKGSDLWNRGFWYSDPKRIYVESTRAHNTIEIDGRSFDRKGSKPYGSAIERWGETEDGLFFIETHARQFRTIHHARLLVFRPHEWLLIFDWVWDNLKEKHDYRQWFHFAPDLTVMQAGSALLVSGDDLDTELKVVSLLSSPLLAQPVRGQEEPTLLGWWSEKGGHFEPVTSVNFYIEDSPSAVFATLFALSNEAVCSHPDDQRVNASGRRARLRWSTGHRTHTLSFDRPSDGDVSLDYSTQSRPDSASSAVADCDT